MSEDLKQLSALTALNDMMSKAHFNICCVDRVGELLGIDPRRTDAYRILAPLHCVDWGKMPQQLRAAVPGLIQECLGVAPSFQFKTIRQEVIEVAPEKPQRPAILRLLGRG